MLPSELFSFVESGLSTIIGSVSPDGRPQCMRGIGVPIRDEGRIGRVFLPCAVAGPTLDNLGNTRRIAVTVSQIATHRTVQMKGAVDAIALATEADRTQMEHLFALFVEQLVFIGFPRTRANRVNRWPCWMVDFKISEVFEQTPGPRAGHRFAKEDLWV
jgi:hypothetical protein